MNTVIDFFEKNISDKSVLYEKLNDIWFGFSSRHIKSLAENFCIKFDASKFKDNARIVLIKHENSVEDFAKWLAVQYAGGIPVMRAHDLLEGWTVTMDIKLSAGCQYVLFEELYNPENADNPDNLIQYIDKNESSIGFIHAHFQKQQYLKFTVSAIKNLIDSCIIETEKKAVLYGNTLLDWGMAVNLIICMGSGSEIYLSKGFKAGMYGMNRETFSDILINELTEINPTEFYGCDYIYSDIMEHANMILENTPEISKKDLKEMIFGSNVSIFYASIYCTIDRMNALRVFFKDKMGIDIMYQLYQSELIISFRDKKTNPKYGSIGIKFNDDVKYYFDNTNTLYIKTNSMFSDYVGSEPRLNRDLNGYWKSFYIGYEDGNHIYITGRLDDRV